VFRGNGICKFPPEILEKIRQIDGGLFHIATTRQISAADRSKYNHLLLPGQEGENASTLPLVEMGKYSTRKGTDAVFDRVPHTDKWKKTFAAILKREKKKRRI